MGCFIGVGSRRRRTSSDGQECAVRANGINGFSAKVKGVALLVTVIVALLMLATPMRAQAASFAEETVADPSTQFSYRDLIGNDSKGYVTENVGRIWPDKTVSTSDIKITPGTVSKDADEDFLVMLSALSSTSNTTTMESKPLDIVMVFDVSGSMRENFGTEYLYTPTYDVSLFSRTTYYALVDNEYQEIKRVGLHWELDGKRVDPKSSADDPNGIQFYTRETSTRLDALKNAANSFIDKADELNNEMNDPAKHHRIAITTFANNATTVQKLTDNASSLKTSVNDLTANGATRADYGMRQAQTVLNGARDGAQKVVIFFTDGEPTSGNTFEGKVANDTIETSKTLKDAGALVYSIGIFDGADENSTNDRNNQYMQGVSSNYLNATAYTALGARNPDGKKYYRSAKDAGELNSVFNEIFDAVSSTPLSPTEIKDGYDAGKSGYLTFTDQLGAYMHVTRFHELSFAEQLHKPSDTVNTDANGVKTYHYTGTVSNAQYPKANLADIIVQVTPGKTLADGDTVTVKIPASMIPLRHLQMLTGEDGNRTFSIKEILPLRVIYGVSLKDEVREAIAKGLDQNGADGAALQSYIDSHSNEDGTISFYSNYYDGSIKGQLDSSKTLGNTVANFTPAKTNSFYFFTEDTPLYEDEACTQKLTFDELEDASFNQPIYYERRYIKSTAADGTGKVTDEVYHQEIPAANLLYVRSHIGRDSDGYAFIKKGSTRLTRANSIKFDKGENPTGTAPEVLGPQWNDLENGQQVNVHLGNNGKLDMELPATLAIYKNAQVTAGKNLDASVTKNKDFTFEVTVNPASLNESGAYTAGIRDATNTLVGDHFTVTFDKKTGKCKKPLKLQDEQTLHIHGLSGGTTYTVTEVGNPKGFTNTSKTDDTGTLAANATSTARFVNTYDVNPVTLSADNFVKYEKEFDKWDQANSFTFDLMADNANYPMPEGSTGRNKTVQVTNDAKTGNFGSVTYTHPGKYTYTVVETRPQGAAVPGVTYSRASYSVTVVVTDNGDGTLSATSSMLKTADDRGNALNEDVGDRVAKFKNTFDVDSVYAGPVAHKYYDDKTGNGNMTGSNPISDGKFSFKGYPVGENKDSAPMPDGAKDGVLTVKNVGNSVNYQQVEFTHKHVGHTYTYMLEEVMPAEANADNDYTYQGMTYDPVKYKVEFVVTAQEVEGVSTVHVAKTYYKVVNGVDEQNPTPETEVAFHNSYDPEDLTLPNDTDNVPLGTKTLNGRDSLDGETFEFTLSAGNVSTSTALANDFIIFGGDPAAETATATVSKLEDGVAKDFDFGSMTIKRPGTYMFKAHENAPAADGNGMAYDRRNVIITIKVKDTNGVLELDGPVTYKGGSDTAATFVNNYSVAPARLGDTASVTVTNILNGRDQKAGEFGFQIEGADDASSKKLPSADRSFAVEDDTPAGIAYPMPNKLANLTFAQEDMGNTFTYKVTEVIPSDDKKLPGVTYNTESAEYKVKITPIDDGDGSMHLETEVTKGDVEIQPSSLGGRDVYTLPFINEYKAAETTFTPDAAAVGLSKVLTGRDWIDSDEFEFTLEAVTQGAPMPANDKTTVTKADLKDGKAAFGFDEIKFDKAGDYTYRVTETNAGKTINGITYASYPATFTVHVTDLGNNGSSTGRLAASVTQVLNKEFENIYVSKLDYGAKGGLSIFKTLNGRDMAANQFGFTVTPVDPASADKFGIELAGEEFKNPDAATAGKKSLVKSFGEDVEFSQDDAGKTYSYVVSETTGGNADEGYTNDAAEYTVTIATEHDPAKAALTVTTKVSDGANEKAYVYTTGTDPDDAAEVSFVNRYGSSGTLGGDGNVKIAAVKQLTGRDQNAGEFSFVVEDKGGNVVSSGKNAADGTVEFEPIHYTSESLEQAVANDLAVKTADAGGKITYELHYKVSEVTRNLPGVVSGNVTSFNVVVKLVDDGDGVFDITVEYPAGMNELSFENTYTSTAPFTPSGSKWLDGGAPVSIIDGKFTFTISGEENAPLPDVTSVKNDAVGDVRFGEITFTQDHLDGVTPDENGARTKTFTYHVTESGTASGITNDAQVTKTFKLTVTDDGQGHMRVESEHQGAQFEFTNTYSTTPKESSLTGEGGFTLTKTLDGRDLVDGEFEFDLVDVASGKVVAKGENDESGNVKMGAVTFEEPGTHQYRLVEVNPNESDGITYDASSYDVSAVATDVDFDGVLEIVWSVADAEGTDLKFVNSYKAAPSSITFNAIKQLDGRDIKAGEFEFELVQDGKVIQTAKNLAPDKSGVARISFEPIEYAETGEFDYEIREVKGDAEGVTYDDQVFTYHVTVTDPGNGKLKVEWAQGDNGAPVFKNVYEKQASPLDPVLPPDDGDDDGDDGGFKLPQTGDTAPILSLVVLAAGVATVAVLRLRRR